MYSHHKSVFENDLEPTEFYLSANYPNPFHDKTKIKYCIAFTARVKLSIFNSEGKEIIMLVDEEKNPGTYEAEFTCANSGQNQTFIYKLEAGDYRCEKKMQLHK